MTMNREQHHEPPQITRVEDILAKMRMGVKEVYEIRMRDMTFPVRVISMDEQAQIRREAIKLAAAMGGDDTDKNCAIQKMSLKVASTLSPGGAPLISDSLLSKLTLDEVKFLFEDYIRVMDGVNPSLEMIPPDHFRAMVDALKKNSLGAKDLSLLQLRAVCSTFVELIQKLETPDSPLDS
jgi:hypothetical protein